MLFLYSVGQLDAKEDTGATMFLTVCIEEGILADGACRTGMRKGAIYTAIKGKEAFVLLCFC